MLFLAIATATARIRGGSWENLAATRFRLVPVLVAGIGMQLGVTLGPAQLDGRVALALLLTANGLVLGFVAANRALPGMAATAAGLVLNVVVIAANGAMPVSEEAARIAGVASLAQAGAEHEVLGAGTRLPWLADVIPIPRAREVLSIGDFVLAYGLARLAYRRMTQADPADAPAAGDGSPLHPIR